MSPVLVVWIGINLTTLLLTVVSIRSAQADLAAVVALNGRAREVAVKGALFQEYIRFVKAALLLGVSVVPALQGRDIQLTWGVAFLTCVALLILAGAWVSRETRREVTSIVRDSPLP